MIPKQAIEKAIEGEWHLRDVEHDYDVAIESNDEWTEFYPQGEDAPSYFSVHFAEIALDPTFWQALGKALGWGDTDLRNNHEPYPVPWYLLHAHRFYDLVLNGSSTVAAAHHFKEYASFNILEGKEDNEVSRFWEELLK